MSLKPPKKSDLGKSWMKNRRDKARMIQPEYHLIASEGTETEPQYFGAIQKIINAKYRDRIQLKVEGIGLFPAYAGVIPSAGSSRNAFEPFPRIRGGDPLNALVRMATPLFSPHTRG